MTLVQCTSSINQIRITSARVLISTSNEKINFFVKITTGEKIVILYRITINDLTNVNSNFFFFKFFVKFKHLIFVHQLLSVRDLIDINVFDYVFTHFYLIDQIYNHLNLESISLLKSKSLRNYDDVISFIVTHVIYLSI